MNDDTSMSERLLTALTGRVLVLTGSGISADSGIPTFRGAGGYWRQFRVEDLATQAGFDRQPEVVWQWYRERRAGMAAAQPNPAHDALVTLAHGCREFLLVTQNVDNLHERASAAGRALAASQIVHIHGEILTTRCTRCPHSIRETADSARRELPHCAACGSLMRPGVVWFGEQLDPHQIARVEAFLAAGTCDAVLVIGTTAVFGYIQQWAMQARGEAGWLVEINPDESLLTPIADQVIRQRAALALPELVQAAFAREATADGR